MHLVDRLGRERHALSAAGDRQAMHDVRADRFAIERRQLVADRHALIQLPEIRRSQQAVQIQLADENDLQQLFLVGLEVRQDPNLFEDLPGQILRFIDDQNCARFERHEAQQEVVERLHELLLGDRRHRGALRLFAREDAEVLQDPLQQVFFSEERIQHQRGERRPIDLLEERAAQRRLDGADVSGDDGEAFAPADGVLQQGSGVRLKGFSANP